MSADMYLRVISETVDLSQRRLVKMNLMGNILKLNHDSDLRSFLASSASLLSLSASAKPPSPKNSELAVSVTNDDTVSSIDLK